MRKQKKAEEIAKKFVRGANSGTDALEVMDQKFGDTHGDKEVTERDKVGFDLNSRI